MAFDGITIHALTKELNDTLAGGRISKIAQPESDELLITIKAQGANHKLLISADPSLPLLYFTTSNKPTPMTAPGFCMLLRKHIGSGRIIRVSQPGLERIVIFEIEHNDEMGDLCTKYLIVELMGKHSNIIFCKKDDDRMVILDSIKHISSLVSSVREVLPSRDYFIPNTMDKKDPLKDEITKDVFINEILSKPMPMAKAIYTSLTGISPIIAQEILYRAGVDSSLPGSAITDDEKQKVFEKYETMIKDTMSDSYSFEMIYEGEKGPLGVPIEFSPFHLSIYENKQSDTFSGISELLETYYRQRNLTMRIRQRSADLRHVVQTIYERNVKKYDLQSKQMKDTEKKDKYKLYGELINTWQHQIEPGAKTCTLNNYYTNEDINIPLDPQLTPTENAQKYFEKYQKMKRTEAALAQYIKATAEEIEHLDSIMTSLDLATCEEDLSGIRQEMEDAGYLKKRFQKGKKPAAKTPGIMHYISSDGYDIYVGKNNLQNDYITFKLGTSADWWFHAKKIPGSHVLVKNKGTGDMPDRVYEEAAAIAAFYSKGRDMTQVEVDYLQKKNVKKPNGAKPGFVIYYTNYSMMARPLITVPIAEA